MGQMDALGLGNEAEQSAVTIKAPWPPFLNDPQIGLASLAWTVDDTSNDGHLDRKLQLLERGLSRLGYGDHRSDRRQFFAAAVAARVDGRRR